MTWEPQEDITTWELAMALNILLPFVGGGLTEERAKDLIERLPPQVRRHFRV